MKFENLNFLEPSGPLQACNGTDLPFFFLLNLVCRGYCALSVVPDLSVAFEPSEVSQLGSTGFTPSLHTSAQTTSYMW